MSVHDAIAKAEAVLPGHAAPDGEIDERWQAIIAVGEFIETERDARLERLIAAVGKNT